jgi:hypothetical protein
MIAPPVSRTSEWPDLSRMHVRIPPELEPAFERAIRRSRLQSSLKLYPILLVLFSAAAILAVFVKASALVDYVARRFDAALTEPQIVIGASVVITVMIALLLAGFLWYHTKEKLFRDYLFCPKCDALDFAETGNCPGCAQPLTRRASFFFTVYDDEKKIVQEFGLTESRKD